MLIMIKNTLIYLVIVNSLFSCSEINFKSLTSSNLEKAPDEGANNTQNEDDETVPTCMTNFVYVQGSSELGSASEGFCVSKFEMRAMEVSSEQVLKNSNNAGVPIDPSLYLPKSSSEGIPWVRVTLNEAISECESLGMHLMTNAQWQTMSRELESNSNNHINNRYFSGHSDSIINSSENCPNGDPVRYDNKKILSACDGTNPYIGTGNSVDQPMGSGKEQRRTMYLSSGEVIWDVSGNVREWVSLDDNLLTYLGPSSTGTYDIASSTVKDTFNGDLDLKYSFISPSSTTLNDAINNVGLFYLSSGNRSGKAISRGANFDIQNGAGIFAGDADTGPNYRSSSAGFRCTYNQESGTQLKTYMSESTGQYDLYLGIQGSNSTSRVQKVSYNADNKTASLESEINLSTELGGSWLNSGLRAVSALNSNSFIAGNGTSGWAHFDENLSLIGTGIINMSGTPLGDTHGMCTLPNGNIIAGDYNGGNGIISEYRADGSFLRNVSTGLSWALGDCAAVSNTRIFWTDYDGTSDNNGDLVVSDLIAGSWVESGRFVTNSEISSLPNSSFHQVVIHPNGVVYGPPLVHGSNRNKKVFRCSVYGDLSDCNSFGNDLNTNFPNYDITQAAEVLNGNELIFVEGRELKLYRFNVNTAELNFIFDLSSAGLTNVSSYFGIRNMFIIKKP